MNERWRLTPEPHNDNAWISEQLAAADQPNEALLQHVNHDSVLQNSDVFVHADPVPYPEQWRTRSPDSDVLDGVHDFDQKMVKDGLFPEEGLEELEQERLPCPLCGKQTSQLLRESSSTSFDSDAENLCETHRRAVRQANALGGFLATTRDMSPPIDLDDAQIHDEFLDAAPAASDTRNIELYEEAHNATETDRRKRARAVSPEGDEEIRSDKRRSVSLSRAAARRSVTLEDDGRVAPDQAIFEPSVPDFAVPEPTVFRPAVFEPPTFEPGLIDPALLELGESAADENSLESPTRDSTDTLSAPPTPGKSRASPTPKEDTPPAAKKRKGGRAAAWADAELAALAQVMRDRPRGDDELHDAKLFDWVSQQLRQHHGIQRSGNGCKFAYTRFVRQKTGDDNRKEANRTAKLAASLQKPRKGDRDTT